MGTDIHMIGEYWDWFDKEWVAFPIPEYFQSRDYKFFAALAGVRNGFGFAGTFTHDPIDPLVEDRGFPSDVGPLAQEWIENESKFLPGRGEHSEGYATLHELCSYDWTKPFVSSGIITLDEYDKLDNHGKPDEWCGGIEGLGVKVYQAERGEKPPVDDLREKGYTHIRVYWEDRVLIGDELIKFLSYWGPAEYLAYRVPENCVRILFDFDS